MIHLIFVDKCNTRELLVLDNSMKVLERSLNYTHTCQYEPCNFLFIDKCNTITQEPQDEEEQIGNGELQKACK